MQKITISDLGRSEIEAWALILQIADGSQKVGFCLLLSILVYTSSELMSSFSISTLAIIASILLPKLPSQRLVA